MKMNLPNKLTILRTVMIPFFILFLYTDWFHGYDKIIAAVIFIAASLTDMLDGKIARKYNLVTNFGKFMDPLADKLLELFDSMMTGSSGSIARMRLAASYCTLR